MGNFLEISKNANKFSKLDINGRKKSKTNFLLFKYIPILISFTLVYISRDNFDFETKTIGALLSLFTGILFGQLLPGFVQFPLRCWFAFFSSFFF